MELPPEITWNEEVKKRINDAVAEEAGRVRICQKVFPTRHLTSSPLDVLDDALVLPNTTRIPEGVTRQFVILEISFTITVTQARNEPDSMICQTLSRMAAKSVALAEDMIIFQGTDAGVRPAGVRAIQLESAKKGLLDAAAPDNADDDDPYRVSKPIRVKHLKPPGPRWGQNVFTAVADGIAKLVSKGQAPEYALFLPTKVYADSFVPPGNQSLVTTADQIRPLVEGGFYGTGVLPKEKGLLVALAGQPTVIYMGEEAEVEYVRRDRTRYFFSVTERVQFVARDPRALVLLEFDQAPEVQNQADGQQQLEARRRPEGQQHPGK
jgi:uncharacterized linocin/CFP29 family protein